MNFSAKKIKKKIQKRRKLYVKKICRKYKEFYGTVQIRKNGFWFIDIPRTSSTSIKAELGYIYGPPYGKAKLLTDQSYTNELPSDYLVDLQEKKHNINKIFGDHIPAIEIREVIGETVWEQIFVFTFVRNPWDRILSLYHYVKQRDDILNDMEFRDYICAISNFIETGKGSLFREHEYYYLSASDYIVDASGKILVDFIGKFENRNDDLKIIAQKIGCKQLGKLKINKSDRINKHYSEYYDQETQAIVRKIYSKDIELFDYKFEA
jgi:hypothetical protein